MLPPSLAPFATALKAVPSWAHKLAKTWLAWFWRLGTVSKIVVTGVEVVLLWYAAQRVSVPGVDATVVVEAGALALCFLCVAGILFGRPGRR